MATAFYGGSFRIGFLPPNYTETQVRQMSPSTLTAFPNQDLDPKNTNWTFYQPNDERNILFHWMKDFDSKDPSSVGGYVVLYVVGPLVTQAADFKTISLVVETAGDYIFAQPNPTFGTAPQTLSGPLSYFATSNIAQQPGCDTPVYGSQCSLQIIPNTTLSLLNGFLFLRTLGDRPLDTYPSTFALGSKAKEVRTLGLTTGQRFASGGQLYHIESGSDVMTPEQQSMYVSCELDSVRGYIASGPLKSIELNTGLVGIMSNFKFTTPAVSLYEIILGSSKFSSNPIDTTKIGLSGDSAIVFTNPLPNESVVTFVNLENRTLSLQTVAMGEELAAATTSDPNTSFVYTLRNDLTGVPIRYFRLTPFGVFTTHAVSTPLLINSSTPLSLVFDSELPMTSPLPSMPSSMKQVFRNLRKANSLALLRPSHMQSITDDALD
jgi:hypothetical protein